MRKTTIALAGLVVGTTLFAGLGAQAHSCSQHETAAGSRKCESTENDIQCGENGKLPVEVSTVSLHVNQTADGGEVEACNDEGSGITQGRLIVKASTDGYVRGTLDSDKDQEQQVSAGYINVQAGATGTGIWCSETDGVGDGYSQPAAKPGDEGGTTPDKWAECIPTQ